MHLRSLPNFTPGIPLSQVHGLHDKSLFRTLSRAPARRIMLCFLASVSLLLQVSYICSSLIIPRKFQFQTFSKYLQIHFQTHFPTSFQNSLSLRNPLPPSLPSPTLLCLPGSSSPGTIPQTTLRTSLWAMDEATDFPA